MKSMRALHTHPQLSPALTALILVLLFALRSMAEDLPQPKFVLAWGEPGDGPGQFHSPIGLAIGKDDEVVVTDLNNARVQRFTTEGKHLGSFDLPLDMPPRKTNLAGGIAIDDEGLIYLSYMGQHKIEVYTKAGMLVRSWGTGAKASGDGELNQPGGLAFLADGNLIVADQGNHRVQKFDRAGKFLGKFGQHGDQPGQFGGGFNAGSRFGGPHFVARDSQGRLYTTEAGMGRVQQLSPDGQPLLAWGSKTDEPGGFGAYELNGVATSVGPIGVFIDRADRVWVSSLNDRVQCFTPEGKLLYRLGGSGSKPGEFEQPHGLAMDSAGCLYVADAGNQRIQKFELPKEE
jgi:sugar lactone lactonase YvrE